MFRTRDFIVLCSVIGFLLIAIILTVLGSLHAGVGENPLFTDTVDTTTASYTAIAMTPPDERESRLKEMKRKLADIVTEIRAPDVVEEEVPAPTATTSTTVTANPSGTSGKVDTCAITRTETLVFPTTLQTYAEIENQRVFYTNVPDTTIGTSTEVTYTKQIAFRLPARTQALTFSSCVASEVVAVTPTGLPIRNSDYTLYLNLPGGTLIGYTIDGFEVYSKSIIETDSCGGVSIGGVYRYYLSDERPGVVGCFMGIPVIL